MRKFTRQLVVAAMFMVLTPTVAEARPTTNSNKNPSSDCSTVKYHNFLTRTYLRYSHSGGDYRASVPTRTQLEDLGSIRSCLKRTDRAKYKLARGAYTKRSEAWSFHRYVDVKTIYGKWAVDPGIVDRESKGGKCAANPESTAGGYYQQIDSTWLSALGSIRSALGQFKSYLKRIGYTGQTNYGRYAGDSHIAACAPSWLQHLTAAHLWAGGQGRYTHWAQTA